MLILPIDYSAGKGCSESLVKKFEQSFLKFRNDRILNDNCRFGVVIDESDLWSINKLSNIIRKEVCALGDSLYCTLKRRAFPRGCGIARDDISFKFFCIASRTIVFWKEVVNKQPSPELRGIFYKKTSRSPRSTLSRRPCQGVALTGFCGLI